MWKGRTQPRDGVLMGARALVQECEWYLSGDFAEQCAQQGDLVPAWAWMNLLAHGTEAQLRLMVADHFVHDADRQALAYVIVELLDLAEDGYLDLTTFQRDALVPLELDMFACPTFREWTCAQLASGLLQLLPARSNHRS